MHKKGVKVLVTGANGFIGSHCVKQLLKKGYQVRGSVRSLADPKKYQHITDLSNKPNKEDIELVVGNLTDQSCWDDAVKGCDYVLHVASPFCLEDTNEEQIVKEALEGTRNVINACLRQNIKKVVVTSSNAAVYRGHPSSKTYFNEEDFSIAENCSNYFKSKLLAEKEAWKIYKANKGRIEMSVLCPSLVIGANTQPKDYESSMIFKMVLKGLFLSYPSFKLGLVHIEDVATAHINCLENKNTNGQRYVITEKMYWMKEIMDIMHKEYTPRGYSVPRSQTWWITMKIASFLKSSLKDLIFYWDKELNVDNTKSIKELKMKYKSGEESVKETCDWLLDSGIVKRSRKDTKNK